MVHLLSGILKTLEDRDAQRGIDENEQDFHQQAPDANRFSTFASRARKVASHPSGSVDRILCLPVYQ